MRIRDGLPDDLPAIEAITSAAFPEEDLIPLVRALFGPQADTVTVVAESDDEMVGYVIFTRCSVNGTPEQVALLGPLAVRPSGQGQGIGGRLVQAGLDSLSAAGCQHVYVLGDPVYYGRFDFLPESGVVPPYPLPPEWTGAWQSKALAGSASPPSGKLRVPGPWRQQTLWLPQDDGA